jgi:hypothetical protein
MSEELIFRAIGKQREVVSQARRQRARVQRGDEQHRPPPSPGLPAAPGVVDYDQPVQPYAVEIWELPR